MHKTACSSDFHSTYIHIQSWLTLPIPSEIVIKNGNYSTHVHKNMYYTRYATIKQRFISDQGTYYSMWQAMTTCIERRKSNLSVAAKHKFELSSSSKTPSQDVSHYHISARLYVTSIDEFDFWSHIPLGKSTRIWVWLSWPLSAEIQSHMITRK